MGIGHAASASKQQSLFKSYRQHRLSHGGVLRKQRRGRGQRPLSTKEPLHLVFKVHRSRLKHRTLRAPKSYALIQRLIKKYALRFGVRVEQVSIQGDHLHLLVRAPRRARYHHFFRVVAGQIAQIFQREKMVTDTPAGLQRGTGLWMHRPFTRVVRGFRGYRIVRNYIQLNEQEARGKIRYQKLRLRGLSSSEWKVLWAF